jgi:hypothetical protein
MATTDTSFEFLDDAIDWLTAQYGLTKLQSYLAYRNCILSPRYYDIGFTEYDFVADETFQKIRLGLVDSY